MVEQYSKLDKDFNWGRNTLYLAGSLAYLTLRQHGKPYTMLDIAVSIFIEYLLCIHIKLGSSSSIGI